MYEGESIFCFFFRADRFFGLNRVNVCKKHIKKLHIIYIYTFIDV